MVLLVCISYSTADDKRTGEVKAFVYDNKIYSNRYNNIIVYLYNCDDKARYFKISGSKNKLSLEPSNVLR